ncbi:hypothetical protein SLEP1_g26183 [Rubroshorea leprosula]|uniref:Uncharacterized protein n=1 Tax=Rubroshorea leprosula TaxID=152421 RepID=A0AAV5JXG1_9ROSI|nr:hypothetical protein SLEP1_g26183 [Rubroshorea leprosula]
MFSIVFEMVARFKLILNQFYQYLGVIKLKWKSVMILWEFHCFSGIERD